MSERRLLKFKYGFSGDESSRKCLVKFEQQRGNGEYDAFTFECNDEPHPDLNTKLQAMGEHLIKICELDYQHMVFVKSVTVTHKDMDFGPVRGLVISGTRTLATCNAPMCINSPHKTDVPYTEDQEQDDNNLTCACLDALDELEKEVFAYVDGKRSQAEFDFGDSDETKKESA